MITCRELTEFLDDYVGGALPPERRGVFDEHLAACADCRSYLASYRLTIRLGKAAAGDVPTDVPPELLRAVMASRGGSRGDPRES